MILAGLICILIGLFFWPLLILGIILIIMGVISKNDQAAENKSEIEKLRTEVNRLSSKDASEPENGNAPIKTTLCYIEKDGKWLLQFRNSKPNDVNEGKWIGVGGKFEPGETPEECLKREVFEETGISLKSYSFLGIIEFRSDDWPAEDMFLFKAHVYEKDCPENLTDLGYCSEGLLKWVPKEEVMTLPLWEGDKYFLKPMLDGERKITMRLEYHGDKLTNVLNFSNHL